MKLCYNLHCCWICFSVSSLILKLYYELLLFFYLKPACSSKRVSPKCSLIILNSALSFLCSPFDYTVRWNRDELNIPVNRFWTQMSGLEDAPKTTVLHESVTSYWKYPSHYFIWMSNKVICSSCTFLFAILQLIFMVLFAKRIVLSVHLCSGLGI